MHVCGDGVHGDEHRGSLSHPMVASGNQPSPHDQLIIAAMVDRTKARMRVITLTAIRRRYWTANTTTTAAKGATVTATGYDDHGDDHDESITHLAKSCILKNSEHLPVWTVLSRGSNQQHASFGRSRRDWTHVCSFPDPLNLHAKCLQRASGEL